MTGPLGTAEAIPGSLAVIDVGSRDDITSLRYQLDRVEDSRVALRLPWDVGFLSRQLDFDLLRREARRRRLEVAIVTPDPERQQLAHGCGFPTFVSVEAAASADHWNGREPGAVKPPPTHWWDEEPDLQRRRERAAAPWLSRVKEGVRLVAFSLAILMLAGGAYVVVPEAEITLVPAGEIITVSVPVSVDPEAESVVYAADGVGGTVPSRRIGLEVEGRAEVSTAQIATVASGRAAGEVLFTSRLLQDYLVPAGTVVRTSSTSYPIRFRTTADVVVPANGQATAPIEALDERTGNVGAFQINRVEGVVASAVRVTNPTATTGGEAQEVAVVTQADYDRVREQLTEELLERAYAELHGLLEPTEFLPYPSLRVEAVPKKAYSHFIGEHSERVALNMRLLVSGQAVNADAARAIAKRALMDELAPGFRLLEAHFQVGEIVEDQEGPGWFTFHVAGRGYAAAAIDGDEVISEVRGERVPKARVQLEETFPLAEPPRIVTQPTWPGWLAWFDRVPLAPVRVEVHVTPDVPDLREGAAVGLGLALVPGE